MRKFGGVLNPLLLKESNHDPRGSKCYRGKKSHERFEVKRQIQLEVQNEIGK
jgi:hypothetical protein